jgi:hypothetical protein
MRSPILLPSDSPTHFLSLVLKLFANLSMLASSFTQEFLKSQNATENIIVVLFCEGGFVKIVLTGSLRKIMTNINQRMGSKLYRFESRQCFASRFTSRRRKLYLSNVAAVQSEDPSRRTTNTENQRRIAPTVLTRITFPSAGTLF